MNLQTALDLDFDPEQHADTLYIDRASDEDECGIPEEDYEELAKHLASEIWPEEYRAVLAKLDAKRSFQWITHVREGTRLVYHEGNLMADRLSNPTADLVAKLMAEAAKRNLVELTQSRDKGHSLYRARRTGFALRSKDTRALERILEEKK